MRKVKHNIFILLLLTMLVGCNENAMNGVAEDTVPECGYIFFNTEVHSRGVLFENENDILDKDFGVLGYNYSRTNEWNVAKATATPNVFPNQIIRWDGTKHSYTPLKPWLDDKRYTFFAYYPTDLTLSGANETGEPYINYTLSRNSVNQHKDVMTAIVRDAEPLKGQDNSVQFYMIHRLTALDVVAYNYTNKAIEISALEITFDNLLFDNVKIPLNTAIEPEVKPTKNEGSAKYTLLGSKITLPVDKENSTNITSQNQTTMIIIPQNLYYDLNSNGEIEEATENCALKGNIRLKYGNGDELQLRFKIEKNLEAGQRYQIQLTFTDNDITIAVTDTPNWSDENINHEFE